ncbi:hypothetical protein BD410DRAFT_286029 [Rickenella mellea]|uniref:Protein kinase domain-containing protein n=1 Tax=Rickenella mellea TaxID=50990 RepID=A0A4Y7Q490_9AGAM|nr:hypothetical protein BD410DRAFT_286029 [Rickenella mellea]
MSGFEVVGLLLALPPIIQELCTLGKVVCDLVKDRPFATKEINALVDLIDTKQKAYFETIDLIQKSGKLTEKQAAMIIVRLEWIKENYIVAQVVLGKWMTNDKPGKLRFIDAAKIIVAREEKSVTEKLKQLDHSFTQLGTDVTLFLHAAGIKLTPEEMATVQRADIPADLKLAKRMMMNKRMEEEGNLVQELSADDIGSNVTFEELGDGFALGKNTTRLFSNCIFNHRVIPALNRVKTLMEDTQRIATLLHDPLAYGVPGAERNARKPDIGDNGLLPCMGFVKILGKTADQCRYDLILKLPPSTCLHPPPRSLRSLLASAREEGPMHPLSQRVEFAIKLCRAVLLVHSADIIHKAIRPESIVVVESSVLPTNREFPKGLGRPYLLGFGMARKTGDSERKTFKYEPLNKLVYHHPRHQHPERNEDYHMLDDIYSLGVMLMEIGIWCSMFRWHENTTNPERSEWLVDNEVVRMTVGGGPYDDRYAPEEIHDKFIALADTDVRSMMGNKYADVVLTCLRSWEWTFEDGEDGNDGTTKSPI